MYKTEISGIFNYCKIKYDVTVEIICNNYSYSKSEKQTMDSPYVPEELEITDWKPGKVILSDARVNIDIEEDDLKIEIINELANWPAIEKEWLIELKKEV